MKSTTYKILAITGLSFLMLYFFQANDSSDTSKEHSAQAPYLSAYSKLQRNQTDALAGNYKTGNNLSGFKDLILDSTYTYTYKIYNSSGEETILEGSWELSYKGQNQHIILHRPLPKQTTEHFDLAKIEEHKFKVTFNGLTDLYTQENYLQLKTDEYSLATLD